MTAKDKGEKFVVVATMVNDWPQGTVIDRKQLVIPARENVPEHDQLERLQQLGAIRPALEHEAGQKTVALPIPGFSPAQQARLQTLDATIEGLTNAVAAHEERVTSMNRLRGTLAPLPSPEEDPGFALTVQEREQRVEGLKARLDKARQQAEEGVKAMAEAAEKQQKDAPAQAGMTGQADPTALGVEGASGKGAKHAHAAPAHPHSGGHKSSEK